jgi:hypothetical protein
MKLILFVAMVVSTQAVPVSASEDGGPVDSELRQRLLTEGRSAWKSMHDAARRLEVVGTRTLTRMRDNQITYQSRFHLKFRDGSILSIRTDRRKFETSSNTMPPENTRVECVNARYAFQAAMREDGKYQLRGFGTNELRDKLAASLDQPGIFPWNVSLIPLHELVVRREFELLGIQKQISNSHACVRVNFEFSPAPSDDSRRMEYILKGWFVVDPESQWRLLESDMQCSPPNNPGLSMKMRWEYEYGEDQQGQPVPTRLTHYRGEGAHLERSETQFDRFDYKRIPWDDFKLSTFGLPEPADQTGNLTPEDMVGVSLDGETLIINVTNRSSDNLRLIGATSECGDAGCAFPTEDERKKLPLTIEPGRTGSLKYEVQHAADKPLLCSGWLHFDDGGVLRCFRGEFKEANGTVTVSFVDATPK